MRVAAERAEAAKRLAKQRKEDTRRMILLGRCIASRWEDPRTPPEKVRAALNVYLTADDARRLWGLDPLTDEAKAEK